MNTAYTPLKSSAFLFFLIVIGFVANGFGQAPNIVLDVNGSIGPIDICTGTPIQIDATIPMSDPGTFYRWTFTDSNNTNREINFPAGSGNGGSGRGDQHTFLRVTPTETTTYSIELRGQFQGQGSITINVDEIPNAGINNTIFLCGSATSINMLSELGATDMSGTWAPPLSGGNNFVVGTDNEGQYTYTIDNGGECGPNSATVTIRPCGNFDFDNDGIPDSMDKDSDNDGIRDSDENAICSPGSGIISTTQSRFALEEDFGTGPSTRNQYVSNDLRYTAGAPQDNNGNGEYNVATSLSIFNSNNDTNLTSFMATDQNPTEKHIDADGVTTGRYLAINMDTGFFANRVIYERTNLAVVEGIEHELSISLVNTNNNGANQVLPQLRLEIVVTDGPPQLIPPVITQTADMTKVDQWFPESITFIPDPGVRAVSLLVTNIQTDTQTANGDGNDVGIDNIFLSTSECDFDRDGNPNSIDLDSDNDGIYDIVEIGQGNLDTNGNGQINGPVETDPTSPNYGIPLAAGAGFAPVNSDSDANDDYLDIDSDNDGIVDNIEAQTTAGYTVPTGLDNDFDGVDDAYDLSTGTPITPIDTNGNGEDDYLDDNSDAPAPSGDCLDDTTEAYDLNLDGTADITPSGTDVDNDGLDDAFDATTLARITQDTNATNGGQTPNSFPDAHDPGGDPDWREQFGTGVGVELDEPVCVSGGTIALFDFLVADNPAITTEGTWMAPGGSPPFTDALANDHLGTFDPSGVIPGTVYEYEYSPSISISGSGCPDRSAKVEITFTAAPNAGTTTTIQVLAGAAPANLIVALGGTPPVTAGGTWSPTLTTDGEFDPLMDAYGVYTYTVGTGTCEQMAMVTVTNCTPPPAPTSATGQAICEGGTLATPLSVALPTGADEIIRWFANSTSSMGETALTAANNEFAPLTIPNATTDYYAETYNTVTACASTTRTRVTLTINTATGDPGTNGTLEICASADPIDLFNRLQGTPDQTGTWTDPNSAPFDTSRYQGTLDPDATGVLEGTYTYTVASSNSCPVQTATVAVTIETAPVITPRTDPDPSCGIYQLPALENVDQVYLDQSGDELPVGFPIDFSQTITITETSSTGCTAQPESFFVQITEDPFAFLSGDTTICLDEDGNLIQPALIFSDLDPAVYSFEWFKDGQLIAGETEDFLTAFEIGEYTLVYSSIANNCSFAPTEPLNVLALEILNDDDIILNEGNEISISDNTITVTVTKQPGEYEYSLNDDFSYQSSNVFTKVPFGFHTVYVRTAGSNCDPAVATIELVGFPKFFTPNGDSENQTWNIVDINRDLPNMTISIFDRYGKLLKTITPESIGWNGTYNGRPMPASDYWFFAQLEDGTQFRSHFSLIR